MFYFQLLTKWSALGPIVLGHKRFRSNVSIPSQRNSNSKLPLQAPSLSLFLISLESHNGNWKCLPNYAHKNTIIDVHFVPLQEATEPKLHLHHFLFQFQIRGLQSLASSRCSLRRETSYSWDRSTWWTIWWQEFASRSTTRLPLQCPRGRDGHPQASHSPDGPWSYCCGAPLSFSGPSLDSHFVLSWHA